jgi:hypothetical protein
MKRGPLPAEVEFHAVINHVMRVAILFLLYVMQDSGV